MDKRTFRPSAAIVACCLALLLTGGLAAASPASATMQTFDTPVFGGYDWVVPTGVTTATFDLRGASGGGAGGSIGGHGGETIATIAVTPGETLKINVGGAGAVPGSGGGTNGGAGAGSPVCVDVASLCRAGGGGGASDVRQAGTALANRVLVAGGGGGAGGPSSGFCSGPNPEDCLTSVAGGDGGDGGALVAGRGANGVNGLMINPGELPSGGCGGGGGTQAAGGVRGGGVEGDLCAGPTGNTANGGEGVGGVGGDAALGAGAGAGGGGGYFGGGGGSGGTRPGTHAGGGGGGGGGSSFAVGTATNVSTLAGVNLGDGEVTVTYTSPAVAPSNAALPKITGTPVAGHTLTCAKGTWTGTAPITYAYKWLRDGVVIAGATSATYLVKASEPGHQLKCRVTASNGAGSAVATSSAVAIKTPPKNTVAPKITGTPSVGKTLSCSLGTWTGSTPLTYTRQWLRNGASIAGATSASYVAKAADAGKFLTCKVTAKNAAGTASKASAATKVT